MQIREIESFDDCSVIILYGLVEEFQKWLDENDTNESGKSSSSDDWIECLGMCTKIRRDNQYVHVVWVLDRGEDHLIEEIGTLAHEATHMVDNLELFICNRMDRSSKNERMPRELRARVVESIVTIGSKMIVGDALYKKRYQLMGAVN